MTAHLVAALRREAEEWRHLRLKAIDEDRFDLAALMQKYADHAADRADLLELRAEGKVAA